MMRDGERDGRGGGRFPMVNQSTITLKHNASQAQQESERCTHLLGAASTPAAYRWVMKVGSPKPRAAERGP